MAAVAEDDAASRGFRRLSSLFLPLQINANKCQRCKGTVYQQERMGPVHDVVFHKTCFRCLACGQFLTLKNYWSNQVDGSDHEIYCHAHVPRIGGSSIDHDALGIRRAMAVQQDISNIGLKARQPGLVPSMDGDALAIRSALSAQKKSQYGQPQSHTSSVDAHALHIKGAMDAQLLQRRYQRKFDKHHFPPHIARKREELFDAQKRLEERLRKEEDELFKAFHEERQNAQSAISMEIEQEWEQRLRELTDKYNVSNKKKKLKDGDRKLMTVQFEKERKNLEATMTMKRQKITQTATLRIREKEQRATAEMVKKQSMEMISLLAAKQQELKNELKTLHDEHPSQKTSTVMQNGSTTVSGRSDPAENLELLKVAVEEVLQMEVVAPPLSPHPPSCRKRDLFPDASVFADIDEQVIKVAEGEQPTYTDLVRQLTENLVTDLEKARAIYRWITVKDLNVMEFGDNINAESPMGLLRGIKFGTETYHVLFMRLCSYAGLHCVEIKGHSKSVGYEPGMKITPDTFQNTWNAILIAGDWRLIQCNWGARHLVLSKDKQDKTKSKDHIRYQYDEHYFLSDPDEFIQEFWPHDPKWQLLENPITLAEFEALPFVRSIFFQYGMRFDGHKLAVMDTDAKGGCKISIKVPEEHENDLVFYYQLRFADKVRMRDQTYKGANLERFVFQTMVDNTITFSAHMPTPAEYFLEIFANKIDDSSRIEESNSSMGPFKLKCACKFKLVCASMTGKMHPLPNCAAGEWGPKKAMRHFGIIPILSDGATGDGEKVGIIMAEDHFQLRYLLPRPLQFVVKLRMNQVEEKTLDSFVRLVTDNSKELTITVTLPQQGQYGLDVYAKPKAAADTNTLSHACKYLINCTQVTKPLDIPKIPQAQAHHNKWGPTPVFEEYGLKLVSHKEPKILVTNGNNTVVVEVYAPQGVQLSYQFLREPDEDNRDYVSASRDHGNPQTVRYHIALPKPGNYMLSLYARQEMSEDKSSPNVYNYLVQHVTSADTNGTSGHYVSKSSFFKKSLFKKDKDRHSDKSSDKSSERSS